MIVQLDRYKVHARFAHTPVMIRQMQMKILADKQSANTLQKKYDPESEMEKICITMLDRELAAKLFVTPQTVRKWRLGIGYPRKCNYHRMVKIGMTMGIDEVGQKMLIGGTSL